MKTMRSVLRVLAASCLSLGMLSSHGCGRGSDGPQRYSCSGEVLFQGQPIPVGYISFEPNNAGGNSGPGSMVRIDKGHYQTDQGKGVVGGAYRVLIVGYDGKTPDGLGDGNQLFPETAFERDLPREDSVQNFEVVAKSKKTR